MIVQLLQFLEERMERRIERRENNWQTEILVDLIINRGAKLVPDTNGKYNVMVSTTGHLRRSGRNPAVPHLHFNDNGNYDGAVISLHHRL